MLTAFAASVLTIAGLAMIGTRRPGPEPAGERDGCEVSVLLVVTGPYAGSRLIDQLTGGLGFSHVAVDACEVDAAGVPLVIDCRPGMGVSRRPLSEATEGRGVVRARLPLVEGRELYGCLRGRVGLGFDGVGLVRSTAIGGGLVCSGLVWECLPARLRARIPAPADRPVAPNDFARAWGARPGGPDIEVR